MDTDSSPTNVNGKIKVIHPERSHEARRMAAEALERAQKANCAAVAMGAPDDDDDSVAVEFEPSPEVPITVTRAREAALLPLSEKLDEALKVRRD